jgi:glycosyltransferase involved in cell wall biosynthesis
MRIGYLVSQYPAPSHTFIRREIRALRAAGLDIRTFSIRRPAAGEVLSNPDREAQDDTWYVLPVEPIGMATAQCSALLRKPVRYLRTLRAATRHRAPGLRELVWSMFYFLEAVTLARELEHRRVQHLHNHFANAGANVGYLASLFLDIDWSFTIHGTSEFDYPAGLLLGEKIRSARWVACVSNFGRAQAMRTVQQDQWTKLFVARCGLAMDQMPARKTPRAEGSLSVLALGRLSPEKAFEGLLEAFSRVVENGADAALQIAGDGPSRASLEERCRSLGLLSRTTFLGRKSEAAALEVICNADVLVVSSLMEGLPVVLMEAMALGVPVIAPRVAGIPELIEHEKTGLLFDPGNWTSLADCLSRMLADRALRERLQTAGRQRIARDFEIGVAIAPLLERYQTRRLGAVDGEEVPSAPAVAPEAGNSA